MLPDLGQRPFGDFNFKILTWRSELFEGLRLLHKRADAFG